MKNFKKILVLALAVIMCVTVLSVTTIADTFNPTIKITARYDDNGEQIIASVVTSQPCGAIKATFSYEGSVELDTSKIAFVDKTEAEPYVTNGNTITFVLLANDLTSGDTYWADFYFTVNGKENVTFSLKDVDVCDVNETLVSDSKELEGTTITLTADDLKTLGAQYRKPVDDAQNPISAALRFGSRIDRTKNTADDDETILHNLTSNKGVAVRCGFLAGFEFKVEKDRVLEAEFDENTGEFTDITTGAINIPAKKCLQDKDTYLIYTYAVTGIEEDTQAETSTGVYEYVKDLPIVARPYVVYKTNDGAYGIEYGAQVSKSYSDVQAVSDLLVSDN